MADINKLLRMKKLVEEQQGKFEQAKGRLTANMEQLNEMGFTTIEAAKQQDSVLEEMIEDKEAELEAVIAELESTVVAKGWM